MKKIELKSMLKWVPVAITGIIAVVQGISEQKEIERVDRLEQDIAKLKEK